MKLFDLHYEIQLGKCYTQKLEKSVLIANQYKNNSVFI